MREDEIVVGHAYTNAKEFSARHVDEIDDEGYVHYRDFSLSTGKPFGSMQCSLHTFRNWSWRRLSSEETARLDFTASYMQGLSFVLELIHNIPDDMLLSECRRRGLLANPS